MHKVAARSVICLFFATTFLWDLSLSAQCFKCKYGTCVAIGCETGLRDCGCREVCSCGAVQKGYLESTHPGLFTAEENATLVVVQVLAGSPADLAGNLVGDEIIKVVRENDNGMSCGKPGWTSGESDQSVVIVRRGYESHTVRMSLVPVKTMLTGGAYGIKRAALAGERDGGRAFQSAFTYGVVLNIDNERPVVMEVLSGSPAQEAGISIGDLVIGLDGKSIDSLSPDVLGGLLNPDYRRELRLTIAKPSGQTEVVSLVAIGMSELLRNPRKTAPVIRAAGE